ncbi:hypothetical protein BJX70DRAFT_98028 [Aspergillus crustosus]
MHWSPTWQAGVLFEFLLVSLLIQERIRTVLSAPLLISLPPQFFQRCCYHNCVEYNNLITDEVLLASLLDAVWSSLWCCLQINMIGSNSRSLHGVAIGGFNNLISSELSCMKKDQSCRDITARRSMSDLISCNKDMF